MQPLELALLLAGVVCVASVSFTVPVHKPDNQPHYRKLLQKGGSGDEVLEWRRFYYRGIIRIGTPEIEYEVDFDTGSPTPWLRAVNCTVGFEQQPCSGNLTYLDVTQSSSAIVTDKDFLMTYGTGYTRGKWVHDYMSVGTKTDFARIPLYFGVGQNIASIIANMDVDGLFGLSFSHNEFPSPIEIWDKEGSLDGDLFTVWLDRREKGTGEIAFGSLIPDKCGDIIVKTESQLKSIWWDLKIDSIKLDGKEFAAEILAITDTGTTALIFPTSFNETLKVLESRNIDEVSKHNLTFTIGGHDFGIQGKDLYQGVGFMNAGPIKVVLGDTFIKQFCQTHYIKTRQVGFALNKVY